MRQKLIVVVSMLALAFSMMAQTATQATPATPSQDTKTCACCNHDKADAKEGEACCKDCCKDGKCAMMSKDGMKGAKCPMMAKDGQVAPGKMCCSGNKCPMHAKANGGKGCCCAGMTEHAHEGM